MIIWVEQLTQTQQEDIDLVVVMLVQTNQIIGMTIASTGSFLDFADFDLT